MDVHAEQLKHLIEQAQAGDSAAFGTLYQECYTPIYRFLFFRLRKKEEAEDMTQVVFTKALRSLDRYKDHGTSPMALFYTIARNTLTDYWRKKRDIVLGEATDLAAIADTQQAAHSRREDREVFSSAPKLESALQQLSQEQQEVIIQRFINDIPTKEIALLLGKSEMAVRQIQSRALKALRTILEQLSQ